MKRRLINWAKPILKKMLGIGSSGIDELKKKGLKVGRNFNMQSGCIIDYSHSNHIEIGDNVTLAPNVHILAHDASTKLFLDYTKIKNTTIGSKVFIGAGSIIMPGVTIGSEVIIGAGSVVTKDVPDNSVYAGNPAKFMMQTDAYIARERAKMNDENTFGEEFTERVNVTKEKRRLLKQMAAKHGTAYLK